MSNNVFKTLAVMDEYPWQLTHESQRTLCFEHVVNLILRTLFAQKSTLTSIKLNRSKVFIFRTCAPPLNYRSRHIQQCTSLLFHYTYLRGWNGFAGTFHVVGTLKEELVEDRMTSRPQVTVCHWDIQVITSTSHPQRLDNDIFNQSAKNLLFSIENLTLLTCLTCTSVRLKSFSIE